MNAPKPAIDAKISVLEDLAVLLAQKVAAHTGADPDSMPHLVFSTDVVLAALLDGAEVREEWGCRLTWDNGNFEDTWLEERKYAQLRFDLHQQKRAENPGWRVTPTLIRRPHLTLAAEVVEGEQR